MVQRKAIEFVLPEQIEGFLDMEPARKYKTLGELEDKYFGKPGTPEREQYETELSMDILGRYPPPAKPSKAK